MGFLDGNHAVEQLGYFVVEGGVPADDVFYCLSNGDKLKPGVNLFAMDNCDSQVAFGVNEDENELTEGLRTARTWMAIDDCGNVNLKSRIDTCRVAAVRLKVLLAGAFLNSFSNDHMRDDLRYKQFLPHKEPYSDLPEFYHRGKGGNEVISSDIYTVATNNAVVDWLFIELRDAYQPNEVLATASALVQKDGDVIAPYGEDIITFYTQPEGNYIVSVRHRNHLGAAIGSAVFLSTDSPPLIDFTNINTDLINSGIAGQIRYEKRMLWAGDLDGNGQAIYQGPYNDIFFLFSEVFSADENEDFLANFIYNGYHRTDLNLDGRAIFQGPNNDRSMLLFNTVLAHPQNTGFLANFIADEFLP